MDKQARINKPSTLGNNWAWRLHEGMPVDEVLTDEMVDKIYQLTRISFRLSEICLEEKRKQEELKLKLAQELAKKEQKAKQDAEALKETADPDGNPE